MSQSQGWTQFSELMLSFVLSSVIGVEREVRQKSAGLRTHALVGVGTTLFMEISKYGFTDVLPAGHVGWDPSRIAAQVVSGIGFIGGGLIFVRRDTVRGLTTAAVVWLTCAIGMACGAGLPYLAIGVTALHFVVVYGYPPIIRRIGGPRDRAAEIRITYLPGHGVLSAVLVACTRAGFTVVDVSVHNRDQDVTKDPGEPESIDPRAAAVVLLVEGAAEPTELVSGLSELPGVLTVGGGRVAEPVE
ncbi:MgtC/SapB family protein [Embleya sp. NBC_00896]|uniref:MgtC/SapB family protein n=1 Tax=Embleya sp. NBC_00896 TaxID=2975961 RepID=UPI00386CE557|nr:MgtC/SapB family protein [Embleya sp. NBC_00896]